MPKKTYKRKRRSISKRSRGMKRYKKTRTRGGVNELYNDNNYINPKPMINSRKNYDFMYNKPNTIINNDKFNYYSIFSVNSLFVSSLKSRLKIRKGRFEYNFPYVGASVFTGNGGSYILDTF